MKRLHYTKAHHLNQLVEQLFAAFPGWRTLSPEGRYETTVSVESTGQDIWLTVPDDTDEAAVAAVVNAHSPDANYGQDALFEWAKGIYQAIWTNKLSVDPPVALTAAETVRFQRATAILLRRVFRTLAG